MARYRRGCLVVVVVAALSACIRTPEATTERHVTVRNEAMHTAPKSLDELAAMAPHLAVTGADGPLHDAVEAELERAGFGKDGGVEVTIAMPALVSGHGSLRIDVHYTASWLGSGRHFTASGALGGTIDYTTSGDAAEMLAADNGRFLAGRIIEQLRKSRPKFPSKLIAPARVTSIGSGLHQHCSLHDDGTVRCWEGEPASRLGTIPMPIDGIAKAVELAVGDSIGCVRLADSTVRCWDESTFEDGNVSHAVCGVDHIKSLGRSSPSCAIKDDDSVVCWSAKDFAGDCGVASAPTSKLVTIPGLRATALAASTFHACAADEHHDVTCWEPCVDTCSDKAVRTAAKELAGATELSANGGICGITKADSVRCTFLGSTTDMHTYTIPGVAHISNGYGFGFGVTSKHELYEWSGRDNTATKSSLSNVTDASASAQGGCVLADGTVWCRGRDRAELTKVVFSR